ncbi:hypothetical protein [Methanobrevibacter sp. DSM 116169]|uniref:hypothetical protein n=1 Tax=Methanobrevibacter sp. DSM 116169 TaxID=3242727 RepID=UPI0038FC0D0C
MITSFKTEETEDKGDDSVPLEWSMKEPMLDKYFLLVRRSGFGYSLSEFWEESNFETQYFVEQELKIIEEERKEANKSRGRHNYSDVHEDNAPEMNNLVEELQE